MRRLTDYRDGLVAERTRVVNRLRWLVHDLDPELAPPPRSLGSGRARDGLEAGLRALPAGAGQRSRCPSWPASRPCPPRSQAWRRTWPAWSPPWSRNCWPSRGRRDHRRQDHRRGRRYPPVPQPGRVRPAQRHRPRPRFQRHRTGGPQRLNRGGNRQLNAALHRIAVVQARCHPGAAALLERRGQDKHETRKASLRVLKRHLSTHQPRPERPDGWRLDQPAPHAA